MSSTKQNNQMFALVDCNNFYASCERVFNPLWKNKPIVVLSNNDGCVIARSNEAKALGIPMGAPFFQYKDLMCNHNVIVCSSNFTLYGDMSARVMEILKEFSPDFQIYSVDEAFLDLQGEDFRNQALKIREKVLKWTGIPVSIGVAKTKTLAKIAGDKAKKIPENKGVFVLNSEIQTEEVLDSLPVSDIWGIGRQHGKKLNQIGVYTAKQFKDLSDTTTRKLLTVSGLKTAMELRGISCIPLTEIIPPKQSITHSRAFGSPIDSIEELYEAIATYTAKAAEKMRSQHSLTSEMIVYIELHPFQIHSTFHLKIRFAEPTNFTPHLIHYAKKAIDDLFITGNRYRKAGVILNSLSSEFSCQQDLFSPTTFTEKQTKLMQTLDQINDSYGYNILHTAAEGTLHDWKTKQLKKSANFSTRWDQLLKIKI